MFARDAANTLKRFVALFEREAALRHPWIL